MNTELIHYGILGMKWGIRRYQNPDGSYTSAGKKRYLSDHTSKITKAISETKERQKAVSKNKEINPKTIRKIELELAGLERSLAKREAKMSRIWDLKATEKEIIKRTTTSDLVFYGNQIIPNASRYVVDKNMTVDQAIKQTKKDTWVSAAVFTALYAGLSISRLIEP